MISENDGNPITIIMDALASAAVNSAIVYEVDSKGDSKRFMVEYDGKISANQIDVLTDELAIAVVSAYIYDVDENEGNCRIIASVGTVGVLTRLCLTLFT